jgi:hypothetical protein
MTRPGPSELIEGDCPQVVRLAGPLVLVAFLLAVCACEAAPESSSDTALCDYYAEYQDIALLVAPPQAVNFDALLASGDLPRVEEEARARYDGLDTFLERFGDLVPPLEARAWHASVEDTFKAAQGFFLLLEEAARQRDPEAVGRLLGDPQFGLLVETDQLGRQEQSLFGPCLER